MGVAYIHFTELFDRDGFQTKAAASSMRELEMCFVWLQMVFSTLVCCEVLPLLFNCKVGNVDTAMCEISSLERFCK